MALQRVPIKDFRGGLNTRDSPFELMPNESPDLQNVTITSLVGALTVRAGKTAIQVATPGVIDHCRQIAIGTSRFLMCSINGKIYSCDSTGTFVVRFSGTAGSVWDFAQFSDSTGKEWVWCCNGIDAPQKWDPTTASTVGWAALPPNGTRLLAWRNKLLITGLSTAVGRLYISKLSDPEQATGTFDFIDLRSDEDEFDAITELNILADRLYVFKQRSVYLMTDPSTFANRRIGEPGCYSRFQSDVIEQKLYFLNEQGLWSTEGVAVTLESGSITNYFPQNMNIAALAKARVLGTRDSYPRVLISLPVAGSSVNNVLIEAIPHINFRRIGGRRYLLLPAFMLHTLSASSLANWKPTTSSEWGVYGGDSGLSKLYQYFQGATDDGVQINAHWQSSWIAIQGEEPFERVRRLNVELSGDCIVDVLKDFGNTPDFTALLPQSSVANLVTNGTFETGTVGGGPAGWTISSGAGLPTVVVSSNWAHSGSRSMRVTQNGVGATDTAVLAAPVASQGNWAPASPGNDYVMTAYYNWVTASAGGKIQLSILWLDSSGNIIKQDYSIAVTAVGVGTLTIDSTPPPGATEVGCWIVVGGNGSLTNLDMYFDDISLSPAKPYRFARVRPESRGRFHSIRFSTPTSYTNPFFINGAELVIRGGKEH